MRNRAMRYRRDDQSVDLERSVLLLIRSLNIGGAERQLVLLAMTLKSKRINVQVLTFYPGGVLRGELEQAGVPIADLGKRGRWDLWFLWRLMGELRLARPQVVYSFLPAANLVACLSKIVLRATRIVWGVRASDVDLRHDWLSRAIARLEARLSYCPDAIIANSEAGRKHHIKLGFPAERMHVVENGIDTDRFSFDAAGRERVRREWGVGDEDILIGVAARLDPMKDHDTFLEAAADLAEPPSVLRFACVGDGSVELARHLKERAAALGLDDRVIWAGTRHDMPAVYSAFDIACSPSRFEGFSNAIAEAMACERPCVVTDVGDSARLVGETGWVVPPGDADGLAAALTTVVRLSPEERSARGIAARRRIEAEFGVRRMVDKVIELLGL